jgi:hypothetical protein
MECNLQPQARSRFFLALFAVAVILLMWAAEMYKSRRRQIANDNPQDFFLRGTTSSFSYYFRYDPRAADEWLFRSGARLINTSAPPMISK